MRRSIVVLASVCLLALTGCGASSDDLRGFLDEHYEGVGEYRALSKGELEVSDGNVLVKLGEDGTETAAMHYCEWIGEWLYDQGNGDPSSDITIVDETGSVLSERGSDRAACSFGAG